ncbi:hypothetical protein HID58_005214 [Brassica napus]|uniref:TIR domain-containing protein n=1 Tax=Brassica napus TaxID=3708 RepID=A0ABQ8E7Y3_BRANA|nr:hypothetical protein HID58_005214 [Brassica napus]
MAFLEMEEEAREMEAARLYDVLHEKEKVCVFHDNEGMERGEEINPSLVTRIEDSAASLVVFSPRHADSHWCLEELAKLCDLSSLLDRSMIPIFYKVDPSHVLKQNEGEDDDEMIGLVVKIVLAEANNTPEQVGEYTVGLESQSWRIHGWLGCARTLVATLLHWFSAASSNLSPVLPSHYNNKGGNSTTINQQHDHHRIIGYKKYVLYRFMDLEEFQLVGFWF